MDKLTRYNQKLLAIIGTSIIISAVILIIVGLGLFLISIFSSSKDQDSGIQVKDNSNVLSDSVFLRTQAVTFDTEYQLDTAKALYLIPIGQVNLENEERIILEKGREFNYSSSDFDYAYHYGLFNNFILFDVAAGKRTKLFDEKVAITRWSYEKIDSTELLLFKGTKNDTNDDKILDENDFQSIFIYFINSKELMEHSIKGKTVLDFEPLQKTQLVSIKVGIDKNADFEFDRNREPQEILTLNVETKKFEYLIPEEVKKEIQQSIDN